MVTAERTADMLRPWLGSDFVACHPEVIRQAAMRLNAFGFNRDDLSLVQQDVDSMLFMAVRNATSGRMVLRMDTDDLIRVRVSDFSVMADELMYLLLEDLPRDQRTLDAIRAYSLRTSSLSSLKALYLLFPHAQTEEELHTLRRVIKTCHPHFRWRQWLNP